MSPIIIGAYTYALRKVALQDFKKEFFLFLFEDARD